MTDIADRIPPHNYQAEESVLGAVMLNNSILDDIMQIVDVNDFYRQSNADIYQTMVEMRSRGEAIDTLTLSSALESKGKIESVGGKIHILDIVDSCTTAANAKRYAQIVRDCSKMRQMISIGVHLQSLGYDPSAMGSVDEYIGEAVFLTTALAMAHQTSAIPVGTVLEEFLRISRDGERNYFSPPGIDFARIKAGDLVVLAAGTSVGKTAITLNWADAWSRHKRVTYFEYEMCESDLVSRLVCKHAGVTLPAIQDGLLTEEEHQRIEDAVEILRGRNLRIEEVWCDIGTLMAKIRREAQQGAEVVVVDHLGLIPFHMPKGMNYAKAVGTMITNPLKRLASELGIVIVLLVQLNREGQKEQHGFPRLFHLRDSGEIEQDASIVLMLWSERQVQDSAKRYELREESGILEADEIMSEDFTLVHVGVEKNRNGRLGEKYLLFRGEYFDYEDRQSETVIPHSFAQMALKGTDAE